MKLSPSFVLALAAASSATASPLLKRQMSSSSDGLPTPSAVSAASSMLSSSSSVDSASATSTSSASTATSTSSAGNSTSGSNQQFNDTQILQYALTLEHLEATFYNQSLGKLSTQDFENAGYNASVRDHIYSIGRDEAAHVDFLTTALGNQSVSACTYNFSSVTDVESFLTTARILEGVGVSAYLGAAQNITSKDAVEQAGSILLVEGQHQSYLIAQTNDGGNSIPSPFATPLDFKQVYSLAAPFIESCPESLPLQAFPTLSLSGGAANGSFNPGQQVTVSYDSSNSTSSNSTSTNGGNTYLAIIQGVTGPQFVSLDGSINGTSQVTLPSNLTGGQMYAVVTSSNNAVTDDNTLAGPAVGYVNVPLPQAPEATATSSSSSSSASMTSNGTSSTATDSVAGGAGPTDSMSSAEATATATASGSDSIVSTDTAFSASSTGTQSLASSIASAGSANLPTSTAN
ncbi:related to stress response protein rds1p [Melanopsichium pennsylvanicum]|uniref:Related to stress response protein rds1p n=2 Tax=Melanopsichium pennsylvanicum TaxID=63383 RepID=A0AAJ4XKE2_9BASI|nr:related to stress response protein rds1p [Melanopsichium pennsylvanicum 4]SNX84125.1 related to stress response protein rds1p [Melanopsichium pennsylvanicum]